MKKRDWMIIVFLSVLCAGAFAFDYYLEQKEPVEFELKDHCVPDEQGRCK